MKNYQLPVLIAVILTSCIQMSYAQLKFVHTDDVKLDKQELTQRIRFGEPQHNLIFSLPAVNGMGKTNSGGNVNFSMYGLNADEGKVNPIVSHLDKSEKYISVTDDHFAINPSVVSDINIYFPEAIQSIILEADFDINSSYIQKLKNASYYSNSPELQIINPAVPDCIEHIAILLDQSHSMKAEELVAIQYAMLNWIHNYNIEDADLDLSLITFNTGTKVIFNKIKINNQKNKNKIIKAINNLGFSSTSTQTDWSIGLEEVNSLEADLILFITDSPPNAFEGSKTDRSKALSESVAEADQLKMNGSRIICIGADMLYEDNAIQWFNFITSGQTSKGLIHPNSWDQYKIPAMDYVIIPDFLDLEYILNNVTSQCDKIELAIEQKNKEDYNIYPNPAKNTLTVHLPQMKINESYRYQIANSEGKTILAGQINNSLVSIDISNLVASNYWIQMINNNEEVVFKNKFIKVD